MNKSISYSIQLQKDGRYRVQPCSKILFKFLKRGLESHKPFIERYPAAFLRGFFDGDGGRPYKGKFRISATNSNKRLLKYIKYLLHRYFFIPSTKLALTTKKGTTTFIRGRKAVRRKDTYQFHITKRSDVVQFYKAIGFTITRKMEPFLRRVPS